MASIILYLICTVAGLVLIKLGSNNTSVFLKHNILSININAVLILGFVFYVVSFILWIKILKGNNLSYIVPLTTGLSQVLILVCSFFIFKENFTLLKLFGIMIVLVGVMVINITK